MPQIEVPVITGPQQLASPLFRLTLNDGVVLVVLGCLTLLLVQRWDFPGMLLGVINLVWWLWPQDWGRRYAMWADAVYSWWIRNVLQGVLWENPYYEGDDRLSPRGAIRKMLGRLVYRAHPFPYYADRLYEIGLIHRGDTDTILIAGDGSSISSLELREQAIKLYEFEKEIRRIAAWMDLSAEVGTIIRRRPGNLLEFDAMIGQELFPDVVVPEALVVMQRPENRGKTADELYAEGKLTKQELRDLRLHQINCVEVREELALNGPGVDMVTTVTIRRSPRLHAAAKRSKYLTEKEVRHERIVRLGQSMLAAAKRASVANPHIFDQEECEDFLRGAWDTVTLQDYYRQRVEEAQTEEVITPEQISEQRRVPLWHPQIGIYVTSNVAVFDYTNHAVLRVTKMPVEIESDRLDRLFTDMPVQWLSRTMASEPVTGTREYYGLNFLSALADSLLDSLTIRIGTRTVRRRQRLADEEERVADEGHIEYFNGYVSIAHEDPEELELLVQEVLSELQVIGCNAQRVKGEARICRAVLTATTSIALL